MSMIHDITRGAPRNKRPTRKGRGRAAGKGKTAGRGGKGSTARQGSPHWKPGHEGGQTPLFRRVPKRGFSNADFERRFHVVNLSDLDKRFDDGATVDAAALIEKGLVPDTKWPVKILGDGAITKKLTIVAGRFSHSAYEKIGQAGGTAQNLKGEPYEFPKPRNKHGQNRRTGPKAQHQQGGKRAKGGAEAGAPEAAPAAPEAGSAPAGGEG
jgi:large subunit ribosomal protein L15